MVPQVFGYFRSVVDMSDNIENDAREKDKILSVKN